MTRTFLTSVLAMAVVLASGPSALVNSRLKVAADPQKTNNQKIGPNNVGPQTPQKTYSAKIDPQKAVQADLSKIKPPTVGVDAALIPKMKAARGIDRGPERPLATVTDAKGNKADFVLNELLVATDDLAQLSTLASRWRGRVLKTIDFSNIKLKHGDMRGVPKLHLVQVDPARADISKVPQDLRKIDPYCRGELRFSSEAGLKLLAAGANEAANKGNKVLLNWVMYPASLGEGRTVETLTGETGYTPDAFQWPYMNRGSRQDIGVGAAWQALAANDKLGNRVRIMVTDGGFLINDDLPDWREHDGVDDWGVRDYGSGYPWHGTQVVATLMARQDNGFGVAGPAGPVAELVAVSIGSDFFSFFAGFFSFATSLGGVDIISISLVTSIPAGLTLFTGLDSIVDIIFSALRRGGMLVFAGAGNEDPPDTGRTSDVDPEDLTGRTSDVDAEDRIGFITWEEVAWVPCESNGVICVGGMGWNTSRKSPHSNWSSKTGNTSISMWGPFEVWGYNSPRTGDYSARKIFGTSFATPFVAGVAALVWAANPRLSSDEVWRIMRDTAHRGGVDPYRANDLRVNAFGAVKRALGDVNSRPFITVDVAPTSSTTVQLHRAVALRAQPSDAEDGTPCCTVSWDPHETYSTGSGHNATFVFDTVGLKTITATATDSGGATRRSEEFHVTVINSFPVPLIEQPLAGSHVFEGQSVQLRGSATDLNEGPAPGPGNLACDHLRWFSPRDRDFPRTGCEVDVTFTGVGPRTLTLSATDPEGVSQSATVSVVVDPRPANLPPDIRLGYLPEPNYLGGYRLDRSFIVTATASDRERNNPITYRWIATSKYPDSSRDFATVFRTVVPDPRTGFVRFYADQVELYIADCGLPGSYDGQILRITLEATDSKGNRDSRSFPPIKMYRCVVV